MTTPSKPAYLSSEAKHPPADEWKKLPVIPTYHPSYLLRGNIKEKPTVTADFEKAQKISLTSWKPPKEKFTVEPTIEDVRKFYKKVMKKPGLLGLDILEVGILRPLDKYSQLANTLIPG